MIGLKTVLLTPAFGLLIYAGTYAMPHTDYYVKRYDPYGINSFCGMAYRDSVPMTGELKTLCA